MKNWASVKSNAYSKAKQEVFSRLRDRTAIAFAKVGDIPKVDRKTTGEEWKQTNVRDVETSPEVSSTKKNDWTGKTK